MTPDLLLFIRTCSAIPFFSLSRSSPLSCVTRRHSSGGLHIAFHILPRASERALYFASAVHRNRLWGCGLFVRHLTVDSVPTWHAQPRLFYLDAIGTAMDKVHCLGLHTLSPASDHLSSRHFALKDAFFSYQFPLFHPCLAMCARLTPLWAEVAILFTAFSRWLPPDLARTFWHSTDSHEARAVCSSPR